LSKKGTGHYFELNTLNSADTIFISAAVPPVPPLGDVVQDARGDRPGNARHGFTPRSAPQISVVSPEFQGGGRAMVRPETGHDPPRACADLLT